MKFSLVLAVVTTAVVTCSGVARAQQPPGAVAQESRPADLPSLDYQLGPGDLISVNVSGVREFTYSARVSNSGRLRIPYVGVLFVAGMNTIELEREIAELITKHELVNAPAVRVEIQEYRARPTYAVGELTSPGQFVVTGEMYVLDLIAKAGGLLTSAGDSAFLHRRGVQHPRVEARLVPEGELAAAAATEPPAAGAAAAPAVPAQADAQRVTDRADEVITIPLQDLKSGLKPELNLRLEGGDVLYVPRRVANSIYVIGDLKVPGVYLLPRRGTITAAQAIMYAGGVLATAKNSKAFLMRHDSTGVRQVMAVDFHAILEGRQPDIPIQANDIIYVPNSVVKTIGVGLLTLIPRMMQQFLIF